MSSIKKSRSQRNAAMRPENLAQAEAVLDAHPAGLTVAELADKLCRSEGVTLNRLHGLRDSGRAEWITGHKARNYKAGRWALTKHRAVAIADAEKCALDASAAAHERKKARQRAAEQAKRDAKVAADLAAFDDDPVQLVLPPSGWRCSVPRGVPNSVWALGALA